jgi:hypothetical protein
MTIKLFAFYFKDTIGFRLDMLIIAKLLYADILFQIFNNFLSNQKSLQQIAFFFNLFLAEFLT